MLAKLLFCTLASITAIPSVAESQESIEQFVDRTTNAYNSKRSFFASSGFGAVAVMPHVISQDQAKIENEYITLPSSGKYRIVRGRLQSPADWWFVVNHRRGSGGSQFYAYIGVFIAKRLAQPLDSPLQLSRNGGWRSQGQEDLERFDRLFGSLVPFFELQHEDASQDAFRQEFGNWHAIPDAQTDESSWLSRRSWLSKDRVEECFSAIGGTRPASSNVMVQARLIRFRVTERLNSRSPVVWRVGLRDADSFYLKTFSPVNVDLSGEYCVEIVE